VRKTTVGLFVVLAVVLAVAPLASAGHTKTVACCGVTACCTPAEQADDPNSTVAEAKSASGCNYG
jgi:arsenite methyltransferase